MSKYMCAFLDKVKSKLSQKGQGMVEYAVIIAVVAGIAVAVLNTNLKTAISDAFTNASAKVTTAINKEQ